jgi:hypothetical protein
MFWLPLILNPTSAPDYDPISETVLPDVYDIFPFIYLYIGNILFHTHIANGFLHTEYVGNGYPFPSLCWPPGHRTIRPPTSPVVTFFLPKLMFLLLDTLSIHYLEDLIAGHRWPIF